MKLAPRQAQIVAGLAQGESIKEIACAMEITVHGVKAHLVRARKTTGSRSTIELVAKWARIDAIRQETVDAFVAGVTAK